MATRNLSRLFLAVNTVESGKDCDSASVCCVSLTCYWSVNFQPPEETWPWNGKVLIFKVNLGPAPSAVGVMNSSFIIISIPCFLNTPHLLRSIYVSLRWNS